MLLMCCRLALATSKHLKSERDETQRSICRFTWEALLLVKRDGSLVTKGSERDNEAGGREGRAKSYALEGRSVFSKYCYRLGRTIDVYNVCLQ